MRFENALSIAVITSVTFDLQPTVCVLALQQYSYLKEYFTLYANLVVDFHFIRELVSFYAPI